MKNPRYIEGVLYYRHIVRFTLSDGRRRRWIRWSPGGTFAYSEIGNELVDRFGEHGVKQNSATISVAL